MTEAGIVALGILGAVLILIVGAMIRLPADAFLKLWAALGPVFVGLVTSMGTYFFQENRIDEARGALLEAQAQQEALGGAVTNLERKLNASGAGTKPEFAGVVGDLGIVKQQSAAQQARLGTALRRLPPTVFISPKRRTQ